jgi:mono/diheme cytochrome c family protein
MRARPTRSPGGWRKARATPASLLAALALLGAASAQDSPPAPSQEPPSARELEQEIERLRAELERTAGRVKELERRAGEASRPPEEIEAEGRRIYRSSCEACHGRRGDGKGPAAKALSPSPRNFVSGNFKWRSTPTGSLPLDSDLFQTVSEGVPGTSMPAWRKQLSAEERWAVVRYLKGFSPRFREEEPDEPIPIPEPRAATPQSIARGRAVYEQAKCGECHGASGKGDGPAAPTLRDAAGDPIEAFDFTRGDFRCGASERAIYRTFSTGLDGTPMPGYGDVLREDERFDLVHYVRSLTRERNVLDFLFRKSTEPW